MFLSLLFACIWIIDDKGVSSSSAGLSDTGWGCTADAVPSVVVDVVDVDGQTFSGEQVTWRLDGGDPRPAECGDDACDRWVAGWDRRGVVTVEAQAVVGSEDGGATRYWATDSVNVTGDACHVDTQYLTLTMYGSREGDHDM